MTDFIRDQWRQAGAGIKAILCLAVSMLLVIVVFSIHAESQNNHPSTSARQQTFKPDSDLDGWADTIDEDPLSRAVIFWGDSHFTSGDDYAHTGPAWWRGASKFGGAWSGRSWTVPEEAAEDEGRLVIQLDRDVLDSDLMCEIILFDRPGGSLHIDLLDHHGCVIAPDIVGNLVMGTGRLIEQSFQAPLKMFPEAMAIQIRRHTGRTLVYSTMMYVDADEDGLDEKQEAQLGTSDLIKNDRTLRPPRRVAAN